MTMGDKAKGVDNGLRVVTHETKLTHRQMPLHRTAKVLDGKQFLLTTRRIAPKALVQAIQSLELTDILRLALSLEAT